MTEVCVIDIGGTSFRWALCRNGRIEAGTRNVKPTPTYQSFSNRVDVLQRKLVDDTVDAFGQVRRNAPAVDHLAVGFPGPVDAEGRILQSGVVFGQLLAQPFDLVAALADAFRRTAQPAPSCIRVTNDMTAATWRYCSSGFDPYCVVTVSSCIGNKVFSGGDVLFGPRGVGGEIGHYRVDTPDVDLPCSCGTGNNHIGMISSGKGIGILAREFANPGGKLHDQYRESVHIRNMGFKADALQPEDVATLAGKADTFATALLDYCTMPLADALCMLTLALYIERFIIIGRFTVNCSYYVTALVANIVKRGIYGHAAQDIERMVMLGERDDDHVLLGLDAMATRGKL